MNQLINNIDINLDKMHSTYDMDSFNNTPSMHGFYLDYANEFVSRAKSESTIGRKSVEEIREVLLEEIKKGDKEARMILSAIYDGQLL